LIVAYELLKSGEAEVNRLLTRLLALENRTAAE
jgi:hypothetical protein